MSFSPLNLLYDHFPVSLEEAIRLKGLGFNSKTSQYYDSGKIKMGLISSDGYYHLNNEILNNENMQKEQYAAPSYISLLIWITNIYNIEIIISQQKKGIFSIAIRSCSTSIIFFEDSIEQSIELVRKQLLFKTFELIDWINCSGDFKKIK